MKRDDEQTRINWTGEMEIGETIYYDVTVYYLKFIIWNLLLKSLLVLIFYNVKIYYWIKFSIQDTTGTLSSGNGNHVWKGLVIGREWMNEIPIN